MQISKGLIAKSFQLKNIVLILFAALSIHFCFGFTLYSRTSETEMDYAKKQSAVSKTDSLILSEGIRFIEEEKYDSARFCLLKSAGSKDLSIRTESYLYLNFIETRLENYDVALVYLEQYHKNAMLIYHRAVETEKLVHNHYDNLQHLIGKIEKQNSSKLILSGIFSFVLLAAILALIYLQHKKLSLFSNSKRHKLKNLDLEIEAKNQEIQKIDFSAYLLEADVFVNTPIFLELKKLESQPRNNKATVLNYEKQETLQKEINRIFKIFNQHLRETEVNLTQNDIRLCCLSLLPLNSFAKALSFGSTEMSVVKQRKHYIKKKMTDNSHNDALFNFIFASGER